MVKDLFYSGDKLLAFVNFDEVEEVAGGIFLSLLLFLFTDCAGIVKR